MLLHFSIINLNNSLDWSAFIVSSCRRLLKQWNLWCNLALDNDIDTLLSRNYFLIIHFHQHAKFFEKTLLHFPCSSFFLRYLSCKMDYNWNKKLSMNSSMEAFILQIIVRFTAMFSNTLKQYSNTIPVQHENVYEKTHGKIMYYSSYWVYNIRKFTWMCVSLHFMFSFFW